MHITVGTEDLKGILEATSRVSTKHVTLPVLQCVLLEVVKDTLTVKATNLEIGIEGKVAAKVEAEGVVAVPAQILLQTVNLCTQKQITLLLDGDVLHVETKSSKTEIKSISADEFPHIPQLNSAAQKVNGAVFALGVKTAVFTASQSSIKPELGCVYMFQKKEHTLTFVATDSFRLMEKTVSQQGVILDTSLLIPSKNALELARVCENADEVHLLVDENQCALQIEDIYITSRLVAGSFPDYEQIIPKEYVTHATVLVNDLSHALKKTNIFLNKFMQLTLTVSDDSLTFSSQTGEVGTTTESVHATVDGEEMTLNFNQRYVSEVLTHIVDDSVTLHFAGIGRPMVIESVHDKTMRYLVMPMNK